MASKTSPRVAKYDRYGNNTNNLDGYNTDDDIMCAPLAEDDDIDGLGAGQAPEEHDDEESSGGEGEGQDDEEDELLVMTSSPPRHSGAAGGLDDDAAAAASGRRRNSPNNNNNNNKSALGESLVSTSNAKKERHYQHPHCKPIYTAGSISIGLSTARLFGLLDEHGGA